MITEKISTLGRKFVFWLKRKKRAIATALIVILTLLVCALVFWGAFSVQHVRKIKIKGNGHYTDEQIISASGIEYGSLLYSLDIEKTEKEILEKLPYVKNV